jgi:hypothetical protein
MRSLAQVEREITEVSTILEHSHADKITEEQAHGYSNLLSTLMAERSNLLRVVDTRPKSD